MNQKIKHAILFLFSVCILISTVFIPRVANNSEEMKRVEFGYPFSFMSEDFSKYNGFKFFPRFLKFELDNNFSQGMNYRKLIASFLVIFVLVEVLILILEFIYARLRKGDVLEKNEK